jgi:hypothetical protein
MSRGPGRMDSAELAAFAAAVDEQQPRERKSWVDLRGANPAWKDASTERLRDLYRRGCAKRKETKEVRVSAGRACKE